MLDNSIIEKIEERITTVIKSTDSDDTKIFNVVDYIEEIVGELVVDIPKQNSKFTVTSWLKEAKGKQYTFTVGELVMWMPNGTIGRVVGICPTYHDCVQLDVDGDIKSYGSCDPEHLSKISNQDMKNAFNALKTINEQTPPVVVKETTSPNEIDKLFSLQPVSTGFLGEEPTGTLYSIASDYLQMKASKVLR